MHLISTFKKQNDGCNVSIGEIVQCPPFGFPKFTLDEVKEAERLEVWGSSFNDPGDDFCEFRVIKNNETILTKRVDGY
jgi:hypothetical protein